MKASEAREACGRDDRSMDRSGTTDVEYKAVRPRCSSEVGVTARPSTKSKGGLSVGVARAGECRHE
jgi:hypothetical protein